MPFLVQHSRSGEYSKRPRPLDLAPGQLAVNYNSDSPGLFFRTDTGELVKAGPTHVGTSAPPQSNWTERSVGETWLDVTNPLSPSMKVYTEAGWAVVNVLNESITSEKLAFGAVTAAKITLNGSLIPTESNSFSLGSSSKRFDYIYSDTFVVQSSLEPRLDLGASLGSPSKRFSNIYTGDLHLKNDRGDWTVIEEKDFLSLRNNKTGRMYKIVMEAID